MGTSLMDRIRGTKPTAPPAPVAVAVPPAPVASAATKTEVQIEKAKLIAEEAAVKASSVPTTAVLPPDAPAPGESGPVATPLPEAVAEVAAPKRRGRPPKASLPTAPPPPVLAAGSTSPVADAATYASAVAGVATPEGSTKTVDVQVTIEKKISPAEFSSHPSAGLHLYVDASVDALPGGVSMLEPLEHYIRELCAALEKEYNAADIRCAPADSALGFGKWKGALAALARNNPPEDGAYLVRYTSESEIRQVVVEALRPICKTFVRGMR